MAGPGVLRLPVIMNGKEKSSGVTKFKPQPDTYQERALGELFVPQYFHQWRGQ